VIDMQRQPILTADEVIELLKEALPNDEVVRQIFNELAEETKFVLGDFDDFDDPYTILQLLDYCANYLRNRGIYVYYHLDGGINYFYFIAGECGRVYEEVRKFEDYLYNLAWFLRDNKEILPSEVVAEEKKLDDYQNRLYDEIIFPLEVAYAEGDIAAIKALFEKAQKIVEEINESIKDLRRAHTLATTL
jgi:hypothetical protein